MTEASIPASSAAPATILRNSSASMPPEHGHKARTEVPFDQALAEGFDCAVITTNHKTFDYDRMVSQSPIILDTRNALKGRTAAHIFRL